MAEFTNTLKSFVFPVMGSLFAQYIYAVGVQTLSVSKSFFYFSRLMISARFEQSSDRLPFGFMAISYTVP